MINTEQYKLINLLVFSSTARKNTGGTAFRHVYAVDDFLPSSHQSLVVSGPCIVFTDVIVGLCCSLVS